MLDPIDLDEPPETAAALLMASELPGLPRTQKTHPTRDKQRLVRHQTRS